MAVNGIFFLFIFHLTSLKYIQRNTRVLLCNTYSQMYGISASLQLDQVQGSSPNMFLTISICLRLLLGRNFAIVC